MKIRVDEPKTRTMVLTLEGEVDMSNSPEVRKRLVPLFEKVASHVIVDLSGVTYIDSSGIATLVEGLQLSRKSGVRFTVAGATNSVEAVFELAYLKSVFEMVPRLEQALEGETKA